MADGQPTLVLIDGHSNLYKAYHAIDESLTNAQGERTGAVYGFLAMLRRLQAEIDLTHVAVVFDPPGRTFRDDMFAEYKATRDPAPEELLRQDRRIREALRLLSVPTYEVPGFEADDVLACLAVQAVAQGGRAIICSSDKDLLQVVRPGIIIRRDHLQKTEVLDDAAVEAKLGIKPSQVAAYLGLIGDTSDNIPGVRGIGPKTACKLLNEHGSMEAILEAAGRIKGKVGEALQQNAEVARLSERLATLKTDCLANDFAWERFRWDPKPSRELREFYREMNFQTFLRELGGDKVEDRAVHYRTVCTRAGLEEAVAAIRAAGVASIDTETNDLDTQTADLVGISISWAKDQAIYIPLNHRCEGDQLPMEEVRAILGPALSDGTVRWVAHHWNYDYKVLRRAGFDPAPIHGDTMIANYLINPERATPLRLKDMSLQVLGIEMTEISELIGSGEDMITMASVSIEQSAQYACQDADVTLQLHRHFEPRLVEAGVAELYSTVELPLIPVLAEMEREGVRIDAPYFRDLSAQSERELQRLTLEIHSLAGHPFNINSPRQVAEVLFEEMGLPGGKKGKTGAYSTDVSVLESLRTGPEPRPIIDKLLEFRQIEKLKSTYLDPLPGLIHPRTGHVHTSYNQTIAATGRLSSSNPNLQNIPIRTDAGRQIRRGFLPRAAGWKLLSADYSQIELRILAHLSNDAALIEAFTSGGDIHTLTASKVFGVAPDAVPPTMRNQAKAINFGIIYGMSAFRLGNDLGISQVMAKQFIDEYFRVYSGVAAFIRDTLEHARVDGYVTTMLGRRRFVQIKPRKKGRSRDAELELEMEDDEVELAGALIRTQAERIAVNTPIQGTSADMIKIAMIRIDQGIRRERLRGRMILQVHDELIFDVPEGELAAMAELVREEMMSALPLRVPLGVNISSGDNWAEC